MPIYLFQCNNCMQEIERLCTFGEIALCPNCGKMMVRKPTFPAMVKIKGEGGYPSRRKQVKGTAPYTTRDSKVWTGSGKTNWLSGDARKRQSVKNELGRRSK